MNPRRSGVSSAESSRSRPTGPRQSVSLSVIVPAYNEVNRIGNSLREMLEFLGSIFDELEIIVVDDGSTDGTPDSVEEVDDGRVRCLVNEQNSGKGFSVRRGMLEAKHEILLFSDADLSTPIDETLPLLAAIQDGADIAIASRWLKRGQEVERGWLRKIQGHIFALLVRLTTLQGFRDTQCGFKMFRRSVARDIFERQTIDRWGFDVEILFMSSKWKLRVDEVPVRWFQSDESKLSIWTPLTMIGDLIRVQWNNLLGRYRRQESRATRES